MLAFMETFPFVGWDYFAFGMYFVILCVIGFWAGRKEKSGAEDYFLAGRSLPWYVVGTSYIASNISTEQFIGMIGSAFIYGICIAMWEWGNVNAFSMLIWLFIPFLLATRVFTMPEFLERRFNNVMRQIFAIITVIINITGFLAAVLYGGGIALQQLFGWPLWFAVVVLGVVAGSWAIYGGLSSVAWTDFFTIIIMILGGTLVTIYGLDMLSGDNHSIIEGFKIMIERNRADGGIWRDVVIRHAQEIAGQDNYDRLSVVQPLTHSMLPWPGLIYGFLTVSIWYNALNQFMIQRVLAAKNMYHARMGIVLAGFLKVLMPLIVVIPGLILFAQSPEIMDQPTLDAVKPIADKGYIRLVQALIPIGLRGLLLAALFGAVQSTVNSVLNSTATVFTLDIYKRMLNKDASQKALVRMGVIASVLILVLSIVLAIFVVGGMGKSLFEYIQILFAFCAPPFAAVFLLGVLYKRINGIGAVVTVILGFLFGALIKYYLIYFPDVFGPHVYELIKPFANQSFIHWLFCIICCLVVSWLTPPPAPERVTDQLTVNWRKLNIFSQLGGHWYTSVVFWWGLFVLLIGGFMIIFSVVL